VAPSPSRLAEQSRGELVACPVLGAAVPAAVIEVAEVPWCTGRDGAGALGVIRLPVPGTDDPACLDDGRPLPA
jgi:hypothetical protein